MKLGEIYDRKLAFRKKQLELIDGKKKNLKAVEEKISYEAQNKYEELTPYLLSSAKLPLLKKFKLNELDVQVKAREDIEHEQKKEASRELEKASWARLYSRNCYHIRNAAIAE